MNLKQYKHRNMYIGDIHGLRPVYSYDTLIGYLDDFSEIFYTWGYGRYSTTTSKQITLLSRELGYNIFEISEEDFYNDIMPKYSE